MNDDPLQMRGHKRLVEMEFEILDKQPRYIRDTINEVGSPVQQWLLEGNHPMMICLYLSAWVASCRNNMLSSQPRVDA